MTNNISLLISLIALIISGLTFWMSRIKRGQVKMTRPTIIFFGPDGVGKKHNKVFIRTLLYSTSDRGLYIQNMFIRLQHGESIQNFNVWVYDDGKGLVRGSGLFINNNGIACNHHFLLPRDKNNYSFETGEFLLQVFVEIVGKESKKIFEQKLNLPQHQKEEMTVKKSGIYFDWAPNTKNYYSHVDESPRNKSDMYDLIESLEY